MNRPSVHNPVARLDGAAAEQDVALPFDDAADDDFRILVVIVSRVQTWRGSVSPGGVENDGGAAVRTVVMGNGPMGCVRFYLIRPGAASAGERVFPRCAIPLQCPEFMVRDSRGAANDREIECF